MADDAAADAAAVDAAALVSDLRGVLSSEQVLTLACHDLQGVWAAPVFYALDDADLALVFVSSPRSRHAAALAHDSRCAGAVHLPATDWQAICGVQLAGPVQMLDGGDAVAARALYDRRFAFVGAASDGPLAAALAQSRWYRLRIDEAVLVDNRHGFGARRRWRRPPAG